MLSASRLDSFLSRYPGLTIGLVGDLFLDRYLEIEPGVEEISIETGLEAYQVTRVRNSPGALGTVMNNLAALGVGKLVPITVIGEDGHGYDLLRQLTTLPVDASFVVSDSSRLTPTYTKPLKTDSAGNRRELNRLDVRDRRPIEADVSAQLCRRLREAFPLCDGLVVLDQIVELDWGVVNSLVRRTLLELHQAHPGKLIFVDSRAHLGRFEAGCLKGNEAEILRAVGLAPETACNAPEERDATLVAASSRLCARTGSPVFCTQSERGILVTRPGARPERVPGVSVTGPVDIVGAGDAASSGIVATLLAGGDPLEAATVGNLVASITVQQLGTTGTASPTQLRERHAASGLDR